MKTLFCIRGIPGSGKTTAAEFLAGGDWPVISADDYFMIDGKYIFNRASLGRAHEYCEKTVEEYMKANTEKIFVANTFTTEKEIATYKKLADDNNYRFISLIVENRHGNSSIHNVPDDTIQKMKDRFSIKL